MRADGLVDARAARGVADDREDHHARKGLAAVVQKERIRPGELAGALVEVALDLVARHGAHRHEALLVALARHADVSLAEEEVAQAQRRELRDTQPARVEHFEHGAVAASLGRRAVHGGDDAVDLFGREDVGQRAAELRRLDEFGGRRLQVAREQQVVEEAADAAQDAGLGGLLAAVVVEPGHVALDHAGLDVGGRRVVEQQHEVGELRQVAHVGLHRVVRKPLFEPNVGAVAAGNFHPVFRVFCHKSVTLFSAKIA